MIRKIALPFFICMSLMTYRSAGSCLPVQGVFTATETGCGWFHLHFELIQGSNVWMQWTINGKYIKGSADTNIYIGEQATAYYSFVCGNECSNLPFSGTLISTYQKPVLLGVKETKTGCNEYALSLSFRGESSDMKCAWKIDGYTTENKGTGLSHTFLLNGSYPYTVSATNSCNEKYRFDGKIEAQDKVICKAGEDFSVCQESGVTALKGLPEGGQWRGKGAQGNYFNPNITGPGTHSLIYIYQEGGCKSADTLQVKVIKPDVVVITEQEPIPAPAPVKFQTITNINNYKFSWNFGDQTYSEEPMPMHIYEKGGTFFPTLEVYDEFMGCHQSIPLQPMIISSPLVVTGKTIEFENHICITPNPASGYLRITTDLDVQKEKYRIQICDLSGVLLRESDMLTAQFLDLFIPKWSAGCYLIRLMGDQGSQYSRKIIGLQ